MITEIRGADEESIARGAALLQAGELVAFPTETVYGLGANALNADAVRAIFAAKGRPADNPLIVHIHDRAQLSDICEVPEIAVPLMDAFWPGPLTILMPKKKAVPDVCTAGLDTVAVRMPVHPVALALFRAAGLPVAAPSANRSGKPSPTAAAHVWEDMEGRIPLILDGGPCAVGVESTVLDVCHGTPCVLRPGGITAEMLRGVIGEVNIAPSVLRPLAAGEKALSPGMRYRHYAPAGTILLVEGEPEQVTEAMRTLCLQAADAGEKACVLCLEEHVDAFADCHPLSLGSGQHPEEIAARLFDTLRRLDQEGMTRIYSEVIPPEGVGLAVMNRLGRAASFQTVQAAEVLSGQDTH